MSLAALILASTTAVVNYASEGDVIVLTKQNFDTFVTENPVSLIQFHTSWCGKCKVW